MPPAPHPPVPLRGLLLLSIQDVFLWLALSVVYARVFPHVALGALIWAGAMLAIQHLSERIYWSLRQPRLLARMLAFGDGLVMAVVFIVQVHPSGWAAILTWMASILLADLVCRRTWALETVREQNHGPRSGLRA